MCNSVFDQASLSAKPSSTAGKTSLRSPHEVFRYFRVCKLTNRVLQMTLVGVYTVTMNKINNAIFLRCVQSRQSNTTTFYSAQHNIQV